MLDRIRNAAWLQYRIPAFAHFVWQRFNEVNVPQVSASLTFTTLLALVPLFTVTVVVIAAFPMFEDITAQFNRFVTSVIVPAAGADVVGEYLFQFRDKASNLTAIGIVIMMVTSLMLIQTIERTFNQIWRVSRDRPLVMRVLVYWTLLTLGPLVIGFGMSVWGLLLKNSALNTNFPILGAVAAAVSPAAFITLLLFFLYKVVPFRYVPAKHALIGALVTALLLETVRRGFTFYVANFNSYQLVYGAFAAIPVFLLWLNLLWMILISGAVLTAALSYWQDQAFRRSTDDSGRFDDVLTLLLLLDQAQARGDGLKIQHFRNHINMGYDELGDLLEKLAGHGYVAHSSQGWMLKTNACHINVADLFKLFVYRPQAHGDEAIARTLAKVMGPELAALDMSLADFTAHAGAHRPTNGHTGEHMHDFGKKPQTRALDGETDL